MQKIKKFLTANLWIGPVVLGLAFRLYKLTASSIWHDEGYTMWLLRYNFADILHRTIRDVHPPGYYFIAKVWVSVFGTSVFSIRFLSLIFSVGIIYLTFLIVKRLFNERSAFWSAMLVAASPFLVRFGQEARMYGVVAFFTTLAAYFMVRYIQDKKRLNLVWFALAIIIGAYNQYYAFFVVISAWVIMSIATPGFWRLKWKGFFKNGFGIWDWAWWGASVGILAGYGAWFPLAYKQVTRVSGSYWIKPEWINIRTIPGSVLQFVTYAHFDKIFYSGILGVIFYWVVVLALIFAPLWLLKDKEKRGTVIALYVFGYLPMILVFTLSKLRTPIYQDRYFPFSAVALFALWGTTIGYIPKKWARIAVGVFALTLLVLGNYIMHKDVNHQMLALSKAVKQQKQPGDALLSGELYTFLDGSYYFGYGNLKFLSKPVDGYGESSLFYDQQSKYVVDPNTTDSLPDRVWLIGKSGKDYFDENRWSNWETTQYYDNGALKAVLLTKK